MFHRTLATALLTLAAFTACEILPFNAPERFQAAEHVPPPPPPLPDVCWIEGPGCTGLCTPCPEI